MTEGRSPRGHRWTPVQRAILVAVLATAVGSLFLITFSLALADPVPHRIDAALVGSAAARPGTVAAVERVASGKLAFSHYPSTAAARRAIDQQDMYAALDLTSSTPVLYVASAAGVSVARVLDRITVVDPDVRLVDIHPLSGHDPNGVEIYYLVLIATVIGFFTIFQARVNAPLRSVLSRVVFVLVFSAASSLVLALIDGPWLGRIDLPVAETWGILALAVLAAASFAEVSSYGLGRWAVLPTFLFFAILGNASSGGAVAPPLLPQPFAFFSEWLPTGAAITALRNAVYFRAYQHVRPILVLAAWAIALFAAWLVVMRRKAPAPSQAAAAPSASLRSLAGIAGAHTPTAGGGGQGPPWRCRPGLRSPRDGPEDRRVHGSRNKLVAAAAYRSDQVVIELGPQAVDARIHDVGSRVEPDPPDVGKELASGDRSAGILGQLLQEQELQPRQSHWPLPHVGPDAAEIKYEAAYADLRAVIVTWPARPVQEPSHRKNRCPAAVGQRPRLARTGVVMASRQQKYWKSGAISAHRV